MYKFDRFRFLATLMYIDKRSDKITVDQYHNESPQLTKLWSRYRLLRKNLIWSDCYYVAIYDHDDS